jgi:phosphoglycerate dehydrogenase-like enzyme
VPAAVLVSDFVEERYGTAIGAAAPGMPRVILRAGGRVDGDVGTVEVVFFSGDCYPARAAEFMGPALQATRLRWLHTFSAGVDHPVFRSLLARGVRLTTSSGASASAVAQMAILLMLALARDLPAHVVAQHERRWAPGRGEDLEGKIAGVVGLGPIGLEVARLAGALGMRVVGVRRRPAGDEPCETWPMTRLGELLAMADYAVLALPLTLETRLVVDARALACMRPAARLVNVGRGELVDEAALAAALRAGRIAGAGLDVFESEPLPETSPLWDAPGVIVTPHVAASTPATHHHAAELFVENLGRWVRGEGLRNEVSGSA